MKKILSLLIAITLLMLSLTSCNPSPAPNTDDTTVSVKDTNLQNNSTEKVTTISEGLEFELSEDNSSYVVIGIGTCTDKDLNIPSEYNGKPVTAIGESAFSENKNIKTVTIPDSILTIGDEAFWLCSYIESVTIGNSVTTIGEYAFGSCKLKELIIPDSVTTIKENAFSSSELESLILGKNVKYIGNKAFYPKNLKTLIISSNLEYIGDGFGYYGNTKFKTNKYQNGLYLGSEENPYQILYDVVDTSVTSFVFHENTKFINQSAFSDCDYITSLDLPKNLLSIGSLPKNIKSISIPDSVNYLGTYAFSYMDISQITLPTSLTKIQANIFIETAIKTITIPDEVTEIGQYAFKDCDDLTTVTIGSGVKIIRQGAFEGCNSLNTIYYNGTQEEWEQIILEKDWYTYALKVYYNQSN